MSHSCGPAQGAQGTSTPYSHEYNTLRAVNGLRPRKKTPTWPRHPERPVNELKNDRKFELKTSTQGGFLPTTTYDPADFRRTVTVNLLGSFFLAQAAAQHMRDREGGGKILLMSCVLAVQPHVNLAADSMRKAAISMLARSLSLELAPWKITVNALAPGATVTERTLHDDPDYADRWKAVTPSGALAEPDQIARAALFLLSADADHLTGQTLVVDGGWSQTAYHPHLAPI